MIPAVVLGLFTLLGLVVPTEEAEVTEATTVSANEEHDQTSADANSSSEPSDEASEADAERSAEARAEEEARAEREAQEEAETESLSQRNALASAQDYLEYSSFSRSGLIEQLEFEGYTPAQAEYGVNQTGL